MTEDERCNMGLTMIAAIARMETYLFVDQTTKRKIDEAYHIESSHLRFVEVDPREYLHDVFAKLVTPQDVGVE